MGVEHNVGKYARIEKERRFLLASLPSEVGPVFRRLQDRYLAGTRLRLRRVEAADGTVLTWKIGQKKPVPGAPASWREMTTIYLERSEYEALAVLPAKTSCKRRYDLVRPEGTWVIDVFEGPREGLIIAELELDSDEALAAVVPLPETVRELTGEVGMGGGDLAG